MARQAGAAKQRVPAELGNISSGHISAEHDHGAQTPATNHSIYPENGKRKTAFMIARFIEACVRNRFLVLLIWLLITAWGIYAGL